MIPIVRSRGIFFETDGTAINTFAFPEPRSSLVDNRLHQIGTGVLESGQTAGSFQHPHYNIGHYILRLRRPNQRCSETSQLEPQLLVGLRI